MIRLTLRQFRTAAIIGFGLLAVLAIVLVVTGVASRPGERRLPEPRAKPAVTAPRRRTRSSRTTSPAACPAAHRARHAGAHRALLRRAAHRPRVRDRHLPPGLDPERHPAALARGQARTGRSRRHGDRRAAHLDGRLVGEPARCRESEPFRPVEPSASTASCRSATRRSPSRSGSTAGVLLRRTVPAMAVTLVGFVAARLAVTNWVRPNLASPLHESLPFSTARVSASWRSAATAHVLARSPPW